jgi:hypothetical protein
MRPTRVPNLTGQYPQASTFRTAPISFSSCCASSDPLSHWRCSEVA